MPYDGISFQTKRALMELDREAQSSPAEPLTNYTPGSTLREEYAKSKGLTLEQLKAQQDAQFRALMKKRKAQGYAKGGAIKGALNVLFSRFKHPLSQASKDTYTRLAHSMADLPNDIEYGFVKLPRDESSLIHGTPTEVDFMDDPLIREALQEELALNSKNPSQWPVWGAAHTHPKVDGETWERLPFSSADLSLFSRLPKGGRFLISHPEDRILEAAHVTDYPELQALARSRKKSVPALFNSDLYRSQTKDMAIPEAIGDVDTAIMRSLPLTLQGKDIMDMANTGHRDRNAIFRQFAEDWAKKNGFAGGGLIKGKSNKAPNPEYLPFVQDFVRSQEWSDIGDLANTGLKKMTNGKYMTEAEYQALKESQGYANGGVVWPFARR